MSHRFKPRKTTVAYAPPRLNKQDRELRKMAALIKNQFHLESIIAQMGANLAPAQRLEMQRRCFERIRPHLKFKSAGIVSLVEEVQA